MTEITKKICFKCKLVNPAAGFTKARRCSDGLSYQCRLCDKEYREANSEKIAFYANAYRAANPEKIAAYSRARYKANPEKVTASGVAWKLANPEKVTINQRAWRAANPEKKAAQVTRYQEKAKTVLSDAYIKNLLLHHERISRSLIPQSLIELKRAQIQISNYLKEHSK